MEKDMNRTLIKTVASRFKIAFFRLHQEKKNKILD